MSSSAGRPDTPNSQQGRYKVIMVEGRPVVLAPGEQIVVFAGNIIQAHYWIRDAGLRADQVVIADRPERLMGLPQGFRYVTVGTHASRRDALEIWAGLRARKAMRL
jgi:hypothetical protein